MQPAPPNLAERIRRAQELLAQRAPMHLLLSTLLPDRAIRGADPADQQEELTGEVQRHD